MSSSNVTITPDILLDDGKVMRNVLLFNKDIKEWDPMVAYLDGDYYYLFKGKVPENGNIEEPGIYIDRQTNEPLLAVPSTDEEKKKYSYNDKICSTSANEIIDKINRKEVEVFIMPESSKAYCPEITEDDDILKRLTRSVDKNALFNFKQVLKGTNRLSMLLFDRGIEAFNLKYTIIVTEGPGSPIAAPLAEPLIVSSEDTHELNGKTMKLEGMNDET